MSVLTGLLLLVLALFAGGLFVSAEYALVSLRKSRIDEMVQSGQAGAVTVQRLKNMLDRSIAGSQIGITIANLSIGWIGSELLPTVANKLLGYIPSLPWVSPGYIAFALTFMTLTMVQTTLGEQIPKQIALRLPENTIVFLAKPFMLFCTVMAPFIWLMHTTAHLALKLFGIANVEAQHHPLPSTDEFQILFEESERAGNLGHQESTLLRKALELKALTVREVMIPRMRMDIVPETATLPELLAVISRTKHSKLPVYRQNHGFVGILNTRDLFDLFNAYLKSPQLVSSNFRLNAYVRQAYFVPESMLASALLEEMKARRLQMAIVVDEFGTTVGLICLEDLIEQLVGEIWDEYDTPADNIQVIGPDKWLLHGELTLYEFNKVFEAGMTCAHCTTVAGAVIESLGHQPSVGETVTLGGFVLEVLEMRGQAILKLKLIRAAPARSPGQSGEEGSAPETRTPAGDPADGSR